MSASKVSTAASMIVAGQRKGGGMRMFLIYPEGNFIEATEDTPYLQIGEHKYGKPILDRVVTPETSLLDAQKAVLLSMDSTLRSNLSVGMPLDLTVIERDAMTVGMARRIEAGDEKLPRHERGLEPGAARRFPQDHDLTCRLCWQPSRSTAPRWRCCATPAAKW